MFNKLFIITFLLTFLSLSQIASAHFHYELKMSSDLQVNDKQQFDSIKMTWTYDNIVSKLMLQDEKDTKKLVKQLTSDLHKLQYFTALTLNNKIVETMKPESYQLKEIKHDDYSNLELTFTLPLKTPVSLKGNNTLEINHEDATASAIIFYENPAALRLDESLNKNCNVSIKEKEAFEEGESPQNVTIVCNA